MSKHAVPRRKSVPSRRKRRSGGPRKRHAARRLARRRSKRLNEVLTRVRAAGGRPPAPWQNPRPSKGAARNHSARLTRRLESLRRRGPTTSRREGTARGGGSPAKCKHGGLRGPRREGLRRSGPPQETAVRLPQLLFAAKFRHHVRSLRAG